MLQEKVFYYLLYAAEEVVKVVVGEMAEQSFVQLVLCYMLPRELHSC